tara:strand:- start:1588 stop:1848 length:261 start_codon:yes stop_codon:yes gene_type:complete
MIEELEEAVGSIQQDIYESSCGVEYLILTVKSSGFMQIVEFCGIEIWSSEDDMRDDINDNGDKEPIEAYLRNSLRDELANLSTIKI